MPFALADKLTRGTQFVPRLEARQRHARRVFKSSTGEPSGMIPGIRGPLSCAELSMADRGLDITPLAFLVLWERCRELCSFKRQKTHVQRPATAADRSHAVRRAANPLDADRITCRATAQRMHLRHLRASPAPPWLGPQTDPQHQGHTHKHTAATHDLTPATAF